MAGYRGPGVYSSASDAAPWERYQEDIGNDYGYELPDSLTKYLSGGSRRQESTVLDRAETSYENRQAEAETFGLDDAGRGALGLLERAAATLDSLKSGLHGGYQGLVGYDSDADPETEDWHETNPGLRLLEGVARGMRGDPRQEGSGVLPFIPDKLESALTPDEWEKGRTFGFGDYDALRFDDDDATIERGAKGFSAFVLDTLSDPLTYASFGGSVLGKGAATGILKASAKNLAKTALREGAEEGAEAAARRVTPMARKWFDGSLRVRAAKEGFEQATGESYDSYIKALAKQGDDALEDPAMAAARETVDTAINPTDAWQGSYDEWVNEVAEEQFSSAVADAYTQGGAVGVRKFLRDELGETAGEAAFERLPRDIQGGMRIRQPFSKDEFGTPKSFGVGGGGKVGEKVLGEEGMLKAARWQRRMTNATRASKVGRIVGDRLGGTYGTLWGDYISAALKRSRNALDGEDLGGVDHAAFHHLKQADKKLSDLGKLMDERTMRAVGIMGEQMASQGEQGVEGAREHMLRWFEDPAALRAIREQHFLDDAADPLEGLDEAERAGVMAAIAGHDAIEQGRQSMLEAGVKVGDLGPDYLPRIITKEEAKRIAKLRPSRASQRGGSGAGGFDMTKRRQAYQELVLAEDDGPTGELVMQFRDLTPSEINERVGREVFETDPTRIVARYGDAARRKAVRSKYGNFLVNSGVLASGESKYQRLVHERALRRVGERFEGDAPDVSDVIDRSVDDVDLTEALDEDISLIASDRARLRESMQAAFELPTPEGQFQAIDDMMGALEDFYSRNIDVLDSVIEKQAAEGADGATLDVLRQARKQYRDNLRKGRRELTGSGTDKAKSGKEIIDDITASYRERGLVGMDEAVESGPLPNASVPPELDMQFAPEMMVRAIRKTFEVSSRESGAVKEFLDGWYRPYFSFFKQYATVGRGYGYHARNNIGGLWNNYLLGVTAADNVLGGKIVLEQRKAWEKAFKEAVEEVGSAEGVSYARVVDRSEELLEEAIGDTKVKAIDGEMSLYDVHRMYQAQDVAQNSRVAEGVHGLLKRTDADQATFWQAASRRGQRVEAPTQMFAGKEDLGDTPAKVFRRKVTDPEGEVEDLNVAQRAANRLVGGAEGGVERWWLEHMKGLARGSEDMLRGAAFIQGLRRYGSFDQGASAKMLSMAAHFDYEDLSDFERVWLRGTLIPFYVFMRHNVPLQFRALVKEPGKMNRLLRANDAAREVWGDDEEAVVPEWVQERMGWTSRFEVAGNPVTWAIESPATDLNRFMKIGSNPLETVTASAEELVGSLSPVVKTPVEITTGRDLFTGQDLSGAGTDAPWWYRAIPGAPTSVDDEGTEQMPRLLAKVLQDWIPTYGQAQRLAPVGALDNQKYQDRWLTSFLSQMTAAPVATLTPEQQAGELRARSNELDKQLDWMGIPPQAREEAQIWLQKGLPPEQVEMLLRMQGQL